VEPEFSGTPGPPNARTFNGIGPLRYLLLTTGFSAWHGLWLPTLSFAAVEQQSLVALGWALVCLPLARRSLVRRDVTED